MTSDLYLQSQLLMIEDMFSDIEDGKSQLTDYTCTTLPDGSVQETFTLTRSQASLVSGASPYIAHIQKSAVASLPPLPYPTKEKL